jgi:integrase
LARRSRPFVSHPRHPLTGKQFRVSAATDRELQAVLVHVDSLRAALRLGLKSEDEIDSSLRRLVHGHATIERAAAAYVAQTHLAKNTRAAMTSFVRGAGAPLASVDLTALSPARVQTWLDQLAARGVSPGSRDSYWRRLRALVRFAAAREWIGRLPWGAWRPAFRGRRRVREREAARSLDELARLVDAARQEDGDRRLSGKTPYFLEAKITVTGCLGLRQGELVGLAWPDVSPGQGSIVIARQWGGARPKGQALPKILMATDALFELLERHRRELAALDLYDPRGPVFPNVEGSARGVPRAYTRGECLTRRALRAVVRRAQLPNDLAWSAHSLRDTFATLEEQSHADLATLAQRTRHASLASLLRYLRAARREPPPPGFSLPRSTAGRPAPLLSSGDDDKKEPGPHRG